MEQDFEVTEETVLTDMEAIQEQKQILPVAQGVRVRIEKPSVRKALKDGSKEAPKEGDENPVAYKYLNFNLRLVDGISEGDKVLYKNKVLFPGKMDFVFWHNPEVKTADWWANKQYIFGFKSLCRALKIDIKEVRINDDFLASIDGQEILIDIAHEEEQQNVEGKWVGKGTFKEKIKNIRAWS